MEDFRRLDTEQRNERTAHIDGLETLEIVSLINEEDHRVAEAIRMELLHIAQAVDVITERLHAGGRLIYCGAGTSGRLGVLDAVECPPTYGVPYEMVIGLIAGGPSAFVKAVEGAEDSATLGKSDLQAIGFNEKDVLVGIAASGRTPYVIGAMDYAHDTGAPVIALVCCKNSKMAAHADVTIAPTPGAEVITGSSRMKSGSAQKMVLNMLSTAAMIKLGKVYGNLMVDVKTSNEKLRRRAVSIVCAAAGVNEEDAQAALEQSGGSCKTAITMLLLGIDAKDAEKALALADGRIARAVSQAKD